MNRLEGKTKHKVLLFKKLCSGRRILIFFLCFLYSFFSLSLPIHAEKLYSPITVQIPVYCDKVQNDSKAVYEIAIESLNADNPKPNVDTITVDAAKVGYFEVTATEPGTYTYRVSQNKGKVSSMKYDERVYEVYLCVVNDDSDNLTYTLSVTLAGSATKPDKIGFVNVKKVSPPPSEVTPEPEPEENPKKSGARTSSKTGEYKLVRIAVYGGLMGLLILGAVVYIVMKNRKAKAPAEDVTVNDREAKADV